MAEVQRFDRLSGQIDKQAVARIVVPLGTLDGGLALRDEQMKGSFFDLRAHEATVESRLDALAGFDDLQVGQSPRSKLDFTLDLHGQQRRLKADVLVTRQERRAGPGGDPGAGAAEAARLRPGREELKPLKDMANIPSITPRGTGVRRAELPRSAARNSSDAPVQGGAGLGFPQWNRLPLSFAARRSKL